MGKEKRRRIHKRCRLNETRIYKIKLLNKLNLRIYGSHLRETGLGLWSLLLTRGGGGRGRAGCGKLVQNERRGVIAEGARLIITPSLDPSPPSSQVKSSQVTSPLVLVFHGARVFMVKEQIPEYGRRHWGRSKVRIVNLRKKVVQESRLRPSAGQTLS